MKIRKLLALLLALTMVIGIAACGSSDDTDTGDAGTGDASTGDTSTGDASTGDAATGDAEPESTPALTNEEYVPESGEKYTVSVTADGWVKIENDGGETLGMSSVSGVKIVEDDGYAFKDLNQNGELDPYEDWRLDDETRAADLVSKMSGEEMARILAHGGWGSFTTDPLTADDTSTTYLLAGGRGGVTRNIARGGGVHAQWTNQIQAVAESCYYGIPAMISIDPANISGLIETLSLASTMDTDLAHDIGVTTSQQYRAAGVTALLGPQTDIASPIMFRAGGTYGEDPQLTRDITTAYVNAMQSTWDGDTDEGWGEDSVYCFVKHYAGAGSTEGGRDDHNYSARYTTFPGDNLQAHLITFFDGVFNLPGKTGSSGIMTQYSIIVDGDGTEPGGEWSGAYNPYMYALLDYGEYSGLSITDWGVFSFAGCWGAEDYSDSEAERIALGWERGVMLLGGYGTMESVAEAYSVLETNNGADGALEIITPKAEKYILVMMQLGMFENPYNDSAYADSICYSADATAYGLETQRQSVVMIKNDGDIIKEGGNGVDKPTVYIPYVYSTGFSVTWTGGISEGTPSWTPGMDLDIMSQYFNVVTDTLGEPTGEKDADGNATYTKDDLTRATAEEIQACDYILVGMDQAYIVSYPSEFSGGFSFSSDFEYTEDCVWYPASLQYEPYTATTARETSISGNIRADGTKENRSYNGNTAEVPMYGHYEALQYASENAGDVPVIVSMCMARGMVWSEVEPLADVILVNYNSQKNEVVAEIILGETEPNGLLCFQQPKDMEEVEAQDEDVPRDMVCYTDSVGNTYDFTFGLNWSGVISDERVQTYSADPISEIQSFDFAEADAYARAQAEEILASE